MEKPILFNTEMVKAILDGRKTVTRRVMPEKVVDRYYDYDDFCNSVATNDIPTTREYEEEFFIKYSKYQPEDILWVRETWRETGVISEPYAYRADEEVLNLVGEDGKVLSLQYKWKPSIHMPHEAARIFLKVTDVRVERLQEITPEQVIQEGFGNYVGCFDSREPFVELWESTIKKQDLDKYGWHANPWVFVVEFEVINR